MSLVTLWFPLTVDSAFRKRSAVMPYSFQIWAISRLGNLSMARNRCSTDTYSSPSTLASSSALTSTLFRSLPTKTLPPCTLVRLTTACSARFRKCSFCISIFSISFRIRLSSTVSRL